MITPVRDDKRAEALKVALQQIEKQYGKGSVMKLGGTDSRLEIEGITTGSLALDIALGGKGVPRGRVVEVFGPEASGKTSLCLTIVANVQRNGGVAHYIDAEHALDPVYARKIGVNTDDLLLTQPDYGEQALDIAETMVRSNAVDVIVVDSVAALVPKVELEGEMGEPQMGLQARLMSQALRKLTASIGKSKTCVLFINQIREKIGVFFGNPETTPGGRALKFYASVRIDIRRREAIKEGDVQVGNRVKTTVVKNKIAPPFQIAEFDLLFESGISREGDIIDLGEKSGVVERSGAWVIYKNEKLGQGREKARQYLRENKQIAREIESEIRKKLVPSAAPAPAPKAEPAPIAEARDDKKLEKVKAGK